MANHRGCKGVVKVGNDTIAEVKDWSITETVEILDASVMGNCAKQKIKGMTDATGSITCMWDETDTAGQGAMTVGATVILNLYPAGEEVPGRFASFDAVISTVGVSASVDGFVETTFDLDISGGVTWAVIP